MRLYVEKPSRITQEILSHFEEEGVGEEIIVSDYSLAKSGLADIVSIHESCNMTIICVE